MTEGPRYFEDLKSWDIEIGTYPTRVVIQTPHPSDLKDSITTALVINNARKETIEAIKNVFKPFSKGGWFDKDSPESYQMACERIMKILDV